MCTDEHFAKINDIEYSLSTLLGPSASDTKVQDAHCRDTDSTPTSPHLHDATLEEEVNDTSKISHDAQVAMNMGPSATMNAQMFAGDSTPPNEASSTLHRQTGAALPLKPGHKLFFMVIYLAPGDYHRFHAPTSWVVEKRRHFTGDLFSVSPYIAKRMQDLFVMNERVAREFFLSCWFMLSRCPQLDIDKMSAQSLEDGGTASLAWCPLVPRMLVVFASTLTR